MAHIDIIQQRAVLAEAISKGRQNQKKIKDFLRHYTRPADAEASDDQKDQHLNIKLDCITIVGVNDANRGLLKSELVKIINECRDVFTMTLIITEKPLDEVNISTWVGGRTAGRRFMKLAEELGLATLDKGNWTKTPSLVFTEESLVQKTNHASAIQR